MIYHTLKSGLTIIYIVLLAFLISACGGGSGGGNNTSGSNSVGQNSSSMGSSSSMAAISTTRITRQNTPTLMAGYLDLLDFAKETSVAIVEGDYNVNLPDGDYEEKCDNSTSKLQLTVSGNGNKIVQKYSNCFISITDGTGTHQITISGEESITITRRENSLSTVNLEWKQYSVRVNGESPIILDGTFNYEGLLYFGRDITYENVYSIIKINANIDNGKENMAVRNIALKVDFPALFNRFGNTWPDNILTSGGIHLFHQKVLSASGIIRIENDAAKFLLDAATNRVIFNGSSDSVAYLDNAPQGFFLRWDENADKKPEANIFLTENEYPHVIDNLDSSTSPIYYTRLPSVYNTPYPANHSHTGYYKRIDLSKGATVEIDVQELFTSLSGALLTYEINNEQFSKNWEQLEAGKFLLKLPDAGAYDVVELKITAVDSYGNRSSVITAKVHMNDNLADFDNDGTPDYRDSDIDNDGVENYKDSFPKDPTEHSDLDGDGIGDNTDTDRDNDGVDNQDDAYPHDSACSKPESGNNESCYLTNSRYSFTDKNGIAYFVRDVGESSIDAQSYFVRFDTINKVFLSPTPIFNWPAGYSYGYIYDAESHSIVISNNTHDGYQIWQHVSILKLGDFTVTSIDNSRNHNMYMPFYDQGYLVFIVRAWNEPIDFSWIETYDLEGQLIDSTEDEARATPRDDTYYYLQHSRGIDFCSFSVSVNSNGDIIQTGQHKDRYSDNCDNIISVSENGNYGFALYGYSFSFHEAGQPSFSVIEGYNPGWMDNTIVYIENSTGDLIVKNLTSQKTRTLNTELRNGKDVYISGENILLMKPTGYTTAASMQLYNEELQLIYDSAQF